MPAAGKVAGEWLPPSAGSTLRRWRAFTSLSRVLLVLPDSPVTEAHIGAPVMKVVSRLPAEGASLLHWTPTPPRAGSVRPSVASSQPPVISEVGAGTHACRGPPGTTSGSPKQSAPNAGDHLLRFPSGDPRMHHWRSSAQPRGPGEQTAWKLPEHRAPELGKDSRRWWYPRLHQTGSSSPVPSPSVPAN